MLQRMSEAESAATVVEPLTCTVCKRSSVQREAFTIGRDGTAKRTWCPVCAANHRMKMSKIMLILMTVMLPLGGYVLHRHPDDMVMAFAFGYVVFYLTHVCMVLPHEIAHALVARAVGFEPVAIVVGEGPLLFDRRVLGVRVRIGRWPQGGATYVDLREVQGYNLR